MGSIYTKDVTSSSKDVSMSSVQETRVSEAIIDMQAYIRGLGHLKSLLFLSQTSFPMVPVNCWP